MRRRLQTNETKIYCDYIKECNDCKKDLHYSSFQKFRVTKNGVQLFDHLCRNCRSVYNKEWRLKNKERLSQECKKYWELKRIEKAKTETFPLYKLCKDCKEEKWHMDFTKIRNKNKNPSCTHSLSSRCRDCENEYRKSTRKKYIQEWTPEIYETVKKRNRYHYIFLTDSYVIRSLRKSPKGCKLSSLFPAGYKFPQWLIQAKREHLRLERFLNPFTRSLYERKLTQFCQEFPELAMEARPSLQRLREWNSKSG